MKIRQLNQALKEAKNKFNESREYLKEHKLDYRSMDFRHSKNEIRYN